MKLPSKHIASWSSSLRLNVKEQEGFFDEFQWRALLMRVAGTKDWTSDVRDNWMDGISIMFIPSCSMVTEWIPLFQLKASSSFKNIWLHAKCWVKKETNFLTKLSSFVLSLCLVILTFISSKGEGKKAEEAKNTFWKAKPRNWLFRVINSWIMIILQPEFPLTAHYRWLMFLPCKCRSLVDL